MSGVKSCQIVVIPNFFGVIRFSKTFDVNELREIRLGGVGNHFANFFDCTFKFRANNILVKRMRRIIVTGKIDGGNTKFQRDKRDVGERTLRGFEALARDVSLEVRIGATIINSVVFALAVKLDKKLEIVDFSGKLLLLVSETEILSTYAADFFITSKEEPRLNLRGLKDFYESKTTASVITANALRGHKDIFISRNTYIANGFFVNRIKVSN